MPRGSLVRTLVERRPIFLLLSSRTPPPLPSPELPAFCLDPHRPALVQRFLTLLPGGPAAPLAVVFRPTLLPPPPSPGPAASPPTSARYAALLTLTLYDAVDDMSAASRASAPPAPPLVALALMGVARQAPVIVAATATRTHPVLAIALERARAAGIATAVNAMETAVAVPGASDPVLLDAARPLDLGCTPVTVGGGETVPAAAEVESDFRGGGGEEVGGLCLTLGGGDALGAGENAVPLQCVARAAFGEVMSGLGTLAAALVGAAQRGTALNHSVEGRQHAHANGNVRERFGLRLRGTEPVHMGWTNEIFRAPYFHIAGCRPSLTRAALNASPLVRVVPPRLVVSPYAHTSLVVTLAPPSIHSGPPTSALPAILPVRGHIRLAVEHASAGAPVSTAPLVLYFEGLPPPQRVIDVVASEWAHAIKIACGGSARTLPQGACAE